MKRRIGGKRKLHAESLESRQLLHGGAMAGGGEPPTTQDRVESAFERYDTNDDNEISQDEVSERLWNRLAAIDGDDENTSVSPEELTAHIDARAAERAENTDGETRGKHTRKRLQRVNREMGDEQAGNERRRERHREDRSERSRNRNRGERLAIGARIDAFFAANDTNGDSVLTDADEISAELLARISDADTDGNGVSADELLARHETRQQERAQARFDARFAKLDDDGDGGITEEESGRRWERLSAADADGDGSVTSTELQEYLDAQRAERQAEREANEEETPAEENGTPVDNGNAGSRDRGQGRGRGNRRDGGGRRGRG